ncbi:hypothetical protein MNBD_GAMMA03-295 [hydrothermal vent metagenome]|uniref:Lipoprotein n=1 Tax=hydrothermal vent metagenome TaxID=652676 RepID=A0A3B0WXT9_9ZZZZ
MNMKWMSLIAVMTVFSVGCSESEQEPTNKVVSDVATPVEVQTEEIKTVEKVKGAIDTVKNPEKKTAIKEALSSAEGIPPEKLDSEVKGLVEKISENSDMSKEEAVKLEQDLKSVFQKIEADRTQ